MLEINKNYTVIIEKQDNFGFGITRIDGILVFVQGALPGEEVQIQITEIKKNYARAKLIIINKQSDNRINASCPYYDKCGGCQIMHQSYESQLLFKENKIKELFKRALDIDNIKFNNIIYDKQFNYRNKVVFHGVDNNLGFYLERTNTLLPVENCLLIDTDIEKVYTIIKKYISENKNEIIEELMIRKTSLKEVMISINGNIKYNSLVKLLPDYVKSIYLNNQNVYGTITIREKINNFKFDIFPQAFFQVNYNMMNKLYGIIVSYYMKNKCKNILDLYCGTGTIGILVSPYVDSVVGVEVVEDAVKSANMNKKLNNINNIEFKLGKVEKYINSFSNIDSIIVDPPRSGLDNLTIDTILKIKPKSIIYTSCDPVTLVRDINKLKIEYTVSEVNIVDMFPNTYHVETVCVMEIKNFIEDRTNNFLL